MQNIEVVGSINMDLITRVSRFPQVGETITGVDFLTSPGGKGANQAVAAARLGAKVSIIGCVGNDQFGRDLISALGKENVNVKFVQMEKKTPTGVALITVDEKAQNQIVVIPGANHSFTLEHLVNAHRLINQKKGAMLLQLEIPPKITTQAAKLAKENGQLVILNPAPAQPSYVDLIEHVDFLIPNETEAALLTGKDNVEKAARDLKARGVRNVVITLGERGALYFDTEPKYIHSYKVTAIDPTAAGDAFVAAFTVATLQGKPPLEAIRFANAAGALATTKIGAQPSLPTIAEVTKFISNH